MVRTARTAIAVIGALALLSIGACGGDGGGGGDDDPADARTDLPDSSLGIPANEWTWIDVPGAECMNDTPTGMGVNLAANSDKVMIYLEGGGACFNAFTCAGVAHQNGFGSADFGQFESQYGTAGVFNRDDDDNPFRDWSHVFIPYCTGDIFAGSNPDGTGGRNQVGYENMGFYTEALVDAFGGSSHVVLTGSSAGGFGASYNYDRVQQAFGDTPVTLLDDSAPAFSDNYMTPCLQEQVRANWGLNATLPADCDDCTNDDGGGLGNLGHYLPQKYPDRNFGLITSTRDQVIALFIGWGYPSCNNPDVPMDEAVYAQAVQELTGEMEQYDNFNLFTIDSALHVWLLETPVQSTAVGDVTLTDWIRDLLADDPDWGNVGP